MNIKSIKTGITHAGVFHADDVFSSALLRMINPEIEIVRTFKVPDNLPEETVVFDIGGGEFDHHQKGNEIRENGVPFASFGKLFRAFGHELGLSFDSLRAIDKSIVQPIDLQDNGGETNPLSILISSFNPNWDETGSADENFWSAVGIAQAMLKKEVDFYLAKERAREEVLEAAKRMSNGVVVLKRYAPLDSLQELTEALFVIYPSNRGGYNIQGIPKGDGTRAIRVPFPERWLGNPDTTLGMTFCHPGNFLASADTLQNAKEIACIAICEHEQG